ncbi:lysylphosphatidylglycerol synthase domain-containing protein [Colwellia sp. TT2012]|uniref:lysylphosphatidylglycerol synthase domain-containing protein n=1 Tax=Colwellia sp. TT2012 TaxID=1720342 RepID=UPI00070AB426|nr:lysylphosphatidylglycerol synthase domain-containing protein [Colwellia sp. TT2012]
MKSVLIKYLTALSIIGILGLCFYYASSFYMAIVKEPLIFSLLVLVNLVHFYIQSSLFLLLLNTKMEASNRDCIGIWGCSTILSYLAPFQSGLMIRGVFFHSVGIKTKDIFTASFLQLFINITIGCLIILIIQYDKIQIEYILIFVLFSVVTLKLLLKLNFIKEKLNTFSYHNIKYRLKKILNQRATLIKIISFSLAFHLIPGFSTYLGFQLIGEVASFKDAILISSMSSVASVFSILPNNIGIQEAIISGYTLNNLGSSELGIKLSLLLRITQLTAGVIASIMSLNFIISLYKKHV